MTTSATVAPRAAQRLGELRVRVPVALHHDVPAVERNVRELRQHLDGGERIACRTVDAHLAARSAAVGFGPRTTTTAASSVRSSDGVSASASAASNNARVPTPVWKMNTAGGAASHARTCAASASRSTSGTSASAGAENGVPPRLTHEIGERLARAALQDGDRLSVHVE